MENINKNDTTENSTNVDDLRKAISLEGPNQTSEGENNTQCTDSCCSEGSSRKEERHTTTETLENEELKNEKKGETAGSGNGIDQTENCDTKDGLTNQCTDVACSAEQQPKQESGNGEAIKEEDDADNVNKVEKKSKKNTTTSLLPSTFSVHSDDTDNSLADNNTAEFLSEILPKTSDSKETTESAKNQPNINNDNSSEKNATCTEPVSCSSSNSTTDAVTYKLNDNAKPLQSNNRTLNYVARKKHIIKNVSD